MSTGPQTLIAYLRPISSVAPEDSIGRAAELLRYGGTGVLPVVSGAQPVGLLEEDGFRSSLREEGSRSLPVSGFMESEFGALPLDATLEQARDALMAGGRQAVVVVDDFGRYVGIVTASDLLVERRAAPRLLHVGGMATPFGVYLTTGRVSAGRGGFALVLTGVILFTAYLLANTLAAGVAWGLQEATGHQVLLWATVMPPRGAPHFVGLGVHALVLISFLTFVRLFPLAGIHGAEHKVVHAIERGESLIPEIVERMPRVHPRCGTNLAAGAALFLGLSRITYASEFADIGLLLSLGVTAALWRPLGQVVQWVATTREPTRRQLEQAISAGKELVARSRGAGHARTGIPRRLAASGLGHVLLGVIATALLLDLAQQLFGFNLPILG